ncbi:hypothetical protein HanIR_Chr08g0364661 [Helianthus annuus]|nr:hypothetical protein HanIR_Chr08g0364661 [Helianthus annuus]
MAPGKDNMSESRIPTDLHPVLPSKDEPIYPFRQGKFPFYTRVCNFANYRVSFSRFLFRVLQFFRVHISQVNPFGLSRISHFELSCRAQDRRPDLNVFRYFYEFITAGDWYTFAHRRGVPYTSFDERSSLKNWNDNFFWLDDRCLPEDMKWRFKDQSMSFDLDDDFVFDKTLARALIAHQSPIRPLPEHFLLLGRLCFSWSHEDRKWPVIRRKSDRKFRPLSSPSALLLVASSAQEVRPLVAPNAAEPSGADGASSVPTPTKETAGSSGSQAGKRSILDDVDDDAEIRKLDEALQFHPSSASLTSKGAAPDLASKPLVRKRKSEPVQIRSSDPLPMPRLKKNKKGSSFSEGDVMNEFDEHLTGGKFSREEAALARNKPTPTFSGGFLPSNEVENMETEVSEITSKEKEKAHGEPKMVTFSDVFSDDMEIDPATAEDKFIPDWDIRNKDSVMDELVARTLLFNINTPLDHAKSRKMKNPDLGAAVLTNQAQSNIFVTELYRRWVEAESVRENLEKETRSLKCKVQKSPDAERRITQLTQDLQAQQEKVKSLTPQNQSSQTAAASAAEDRDRISTELKNFSESMKQKDDQHKEIMAKMEASFENARIAYANMMAERDVLKSGEADLKAQIEEMKGHEEEIEAENASLKAKVEELQATKTWMLLEGAKLLAKNIHKGPEMTAAVAAINNAMSAVGVNSGLHSGYVHALKKKKTPYADVPLLNRNAKEELDAAVACFDSLIFPVVEDLTKLVNEPLSEIKKALFFASGGLPKE